MPQQTSAADLYRLAQANKMVRLGFAIRGDDGRIITSSVAAGMPDGPIEPDDVDFASVRRTNR